MVILMVSKKCKICLIFILFLISFYFVDKDDEDEVYNNPNLHIEEQDEFEIPDGKFFSLM